MPKRTKSHEVDEVAQRVFRDEIPAKWVIRKQDPDYGIDFLVEIFEASLSGASSESSGLAFAVQLKGTGKLKLRNGHVKFSLATEHLAYYLDHCRQPVFLVVADVAARAGYWIFLQQYALKSLMGIPWRSTRTVTIAIPLKNRLNDIASLELAVKDADKFMANLRPGAIPASILAERQRLESLDPRFAVKIQATENQKHVILDAKELVSGSIIFKGPSERLQSKCLDLIDRGLPVEFSPNEIEVSGSPLLREAFGKGGSLQFARNIQCSLNLVALKNQEAVVARIDSIPAMITGGRREWRIEGGLSDSPLRIKMVITLGSDLGRIPIHCNLSVRFSNWEGQSILSLAYFEQIFSLISYVAQPKITSKIELCRSGNLLAAIECETAFSVFAKDLLRFFEILRTARRLAKRFNVVPNYPKDFGCKEIMEIEELGRFCTMIDKPETVGSLEISASFAPKSLELFLRIAADHRKKGAVLSLSKDGRDFLFLGRKINIGPHRYIVTDTTFVSTPNEIKTAFDASASGEVNVKWRGNKKAKMRIELAGSKSRTPDQELE